VTHYTGAREIKEAAVNHSSAPLSDDKTFSGSIPKLYETYLVPLIFESYAADLAQRLASHASSTGKLLEIAAGTGVVTRHLATRLAPSVAIVATDLNQAMLDMAAEIGTSREVTWRQADAMQLPFADESFDAVVCQFGVMFFPDKARAFAEARRVLKAGGVFLFNAWDQIEHNEFADCVTQALASVFPDDPPRFLARTPHGYANTTQIARDLQQGGFFDPSPQFTTLAARSRASAAQIPAIAYCQGTPLRNEIEARDKSRLVEATQAATQALATRFGTGAVDGKIQAHVVMVER
jgi:ubiquinone/menaquinone biosynthesis C-methylase UbiE